MNLKLRTMGTKEIYIRLCSYTRTSSSSSYPCSILFLILLNLLINLFIITNELNLINIFLNSSLVIINKLINKFNKIKNKMEQGYDEEDEVRVYEHKRM